MSNAPTLGACRRSFSATGIVYGDIRDESAVCSWSSLWPRAGAFRQRNRCWERVVRLISGPWRISIPLKLRDSIMQADNGGRVEFSALFALAKRAAHWPAVPGGRAVVAPGAAQARVFLL